MVQRTVHDCPLTFVFLIRWWMKDAALVFRSSRFNQRAAIWRRECMRNAFNQCTLSCINIIYFCFLNEIPPCTVPFFLCVYSMLLLEFTAEISYWLCYPHLVLIKHLVTALLCMLSGCEASLRMLDDDPKIFKTLASLFFWFFPNMWFDNLASWPSSTLRAVQRINSCSWRRRYSQVLLCFLFTILCDRSGHD